jgi:hypothetical protein
MMIFYRENTFLLLLRDLALPQGHWIHGVAKVSNKPVITRIREQDKSPGSPLRWLSDFNKDKTRVQWVPFRPGSATRSKYPSVNALRYGFLIASVLKAQRREKEGRDAEEDKKRRRSVELVTYLKYCAKRPKKLGHSEGTSEGAIKSFTRGSWSRSTNTITGHAIIFCRRVLDQNPSKLERLNFVLTDIPNKHV